MAVDEAIATLAAQGESPTTLRFYQWQPGAVSLGRHQSQNDIDHERLAQRRYSLVRRVTGGRAILHIDELTYSIAGAQTQPQLNGPVLDTYNQISQGLVLGLQRLGLDAAKAPASNRAGATVGPVCFEVPSAYEICVGPYKIIGSAQSRRQGYVLQHGSLPLSGDITRLVDVLAVADEAERQALRTLLAGRATTVEEQMKRRVTFWEAATVLIDGLTSALEIDLEEGELSGDERALAEHLLTEKYTDPGWSLRV